MRLMDLLSEELIQPALAGGTRDEVIAELVDLLIKDDALPAESREQVLQAVLRREDSQTTGLGSGVAVPHGVSDAAEEVVAALGIHRAGVDFAAVDGEPVNLVILLVVPPNSFQTHIRTLAGVARVLNDPSMRRLLLAAREASAVMEILVDREGAIA